MPPHLAFNGRNSILHCSNFLPCKKCPQKLVSCTSPQMLCKFRKVFYTVFIKVIDPQGSLPFQRRWKHPTTAPNLNTRRNLSSTTEDATHMIESLPWYHPRYSFHTSNRGAALFDNPFHEAILFLSGVYGKVQPHSTSHQQIPDSILQKCRFSHNLRYSFCLLLSKKVVCLYRVMPRGGLCKLYP